MDPAEFDKFASEYTALHAANISASGERPEYFAEYKIRDLKSLLGVDNAQAERRILDFGGGVGTSTPFFGQYFPTAHVTCIDVSIASLKVGASRFPGKASQVAFDGMHLPFAEGTFDCVFAACVFHHIPESEHRPLFSEMRRVLRDGGRLVIYEHNPWNPLTVKAVGSCEFDVNAVLIHARALKSKLAAAGFHRPTVKYRVFFPRALRWLRVLEGALGWLPLGAQYCVYDKK